MPACQMQCEHLGCNSNNVRDYIRLKEDEVMGWKGEPIALCPEHAGDRIPIIVNPYANIPKLNKDQHQ